MRATESFRLLIANGLTCYLPPTRMYRFKALVYRWAGVDISSTARLTSSVKIMAPHLRIGDGTFIGHEVLIVSGGSAVIDIGNLVAIAPRVNIVAGSHKINMQGPSVAGQGLSLDISIDDGTWVGVASTILGGVRIGKHCIIGAGSLVNKDIPNYTMAFGVPCRSVKRYDTESDTWEKVQ